MSPVAVTVLSMIVAVLVSMLLSNHIKKWRSSSKLPPGSMGWPLVGEGFSFLKSRPIGTLGDFIEQRISRYGKMFTTNIFGKIMIISVDPELSHFMLQNGKKLFQYYMPNHIKELMDYSAATLEDTIDLRYWRPSVLSFFRREKLETTSTLCKIGLLADTVASWEDNSIISVEAEAKKFLFDAGANKALSLVPGDLRLEKLRRMYHSLLRGISSFPLNLPGTTYKKALQAKTEILEMFDKEIEGRMQSRHTQGSCGEEKDVLDWFLNNTTFSREQIRRALHIVMVGANFSSPGVISLAMYLLGGCPEAMKQLREEHQEINRRSGDNILTWENYKCMEFTHCVLNETLRLMSLSSAGRIVKKDVQFKGHIIPCGSIIVNSYPVSLHLDPSIYEDPKSFNPWRWMGEPDMQKSKNFTPFGGGPTRCPGEPFARLEICVFLHHLVVKYDWTLTEPDHPVQSKGFIKFRRGLPIKVKALPLPLQTK